MAHARLKSRIAILERKRNGKPRIARIAVEYRVDVNGAVIEPSIILWAQKVAAGEINAEFTFLEQYKGLLAPCIILVPTYGNVDEWEVAAQKQQQRLLALARSRTSEPTGL